MATNYGELDTLLQDKIDTDNDFQATLTDLSDEDREVAVESRKSELFSSELKNLKERAEKSTKAEELANNYKIRAEKAEKASKNGEGTPTNPELSSKDVIFLAKADIHEDDMDEVLDWAKFKKIPVSAAYSQLKATLQVRAEERTTANATNVRNASRGSSQVSDDRLLSDARSGKMPEKDEDIQRLLKAQQLQKIGKAKQG